MIVIGAYFTWSTTKLEAPVVTSVQFDEMTKTLAVSYVVSKKDPTYMTGMQIDQEEMYVAGEHQQDQVLVLQNRYELREVIIPLSDEKVAYFSSVEGRTLPVDLSFEGHSLVETILVVLLENEAVEVKAEGEQLVYTFTAPEDMTIQTIGHYDSVAMISFEEERNPFVLKKGESTKITIHEPYQLGTTDEVLLEIMTNDDKSYTVHFLLTEDIPKGYLKKIMSN